MKTIKILSISLLLAGVVALALPAATPAATWTADAPHTEVNFSVKHFFTPVNGSFGKWDIDLQYDPEHPEKSTVTATIDIASVNTGNEKRDNHLRSGDWFEVETHPTMTFKSSKVEKVGDNKLIAHGTLNIKGHKQKVDLTITHLGTKQIPEQMQQMLGGSKEVASFEASTSIDRNHFEVGVGDWAGTMVVGDQVDITILLEAHRR
ncbi:MAG: YceI family protein [Thermoanaerobaculia bacterium]